MLAEPNETLVSGIVVDWQPAADGQGGDVVIEVLANESPAAPRDFIKPQIGKRLNAYCPPDLQKQAIALMRRRVRAKLAFLGGPGGGRAVVQELHAA